MATESSKKNASSDTTETSTPEVDPRLDNRVGNQRPHLANTVKPQQIDGPEVGHIAEHAAKTPPEEEPEGEVLGTKSEGPHGRGPHGVTVGDAHGQPVAPEAGAGDKADPRNPAG